MTNPFDIQSLHGQYFIATIIFNEVSGRISVGMDGKIYLCQDSIDGGAPRRYLFGYKFGWPVLDLNDLNGSHVFDLKILPPPTKYHALFQEILEKRGPTWDVDGSYSVLPTEVMASIVDFMSEIKVFEPKNLGNNKIQSE